MDEKTHYRDGNVVLYRRGRSSRWQARFKMPDNSWKRISTGKNSIRDASEVACDKYDEMRFRLKSNLPLDTRRFEDVAKLTIEQMEMELDAGYGKKTYLHYIGAINRYLIPFFKNKQIDTIGYKDLKEFDDWRVRKIGHVPKHSTVTNHNSAFNRIFRTALENNWINEYQIPELKNKGQKQERRPYFTRREYIQLYTFMRTWYKTGRKEKTRQIRELLRDYILILVNTGMRHGTETENLKWNNIEEFGDRNGDIFLRFWVKGKTGNRQLVARHSVRTYLNRIRRRFVDLQDLSFEELLKVDEYVFRCRDGSKVNDWHGAFEILLTDSGLLNDSSGKRRSLYSLRHTYATFALLNGIDIHVLSRQMGTSVGMIEKHYSHLIPTLKASLLAGDYRDLRRVKPVPEPPT